MSRETGLQALGRRPFGTRVFGLRLLYRAEFRRRLAVFTAALAIAAYSVQAWRQLSGLGRESLRWDFAQFHQAAADLAHGGDPYTAFLSACPARHWCPGGYIFPPLLAEVLRPLAALPLVDAARIWLLLTHLLLLVAILVLWRALRDMVTTTGLALLLAAGLLFLPLYQSLYFLQVGVLLLLLLALAAAAQMRGTRGRDTAAGAWLGLAAVLRVTPMLLAPAMARVEPDEASGGRRRLRVDGGVAMALTGSGLLLLLLALTPSTARYFRDVLPRIGSGTGILDNQSLPGLAARAAELLGASPPPASVLVPALTLAFILPTWLLWQRALGAAANAPRARALGFAGLLAAGPIVSSITWQHHLVSELLVYALLAPALASAPAPARWLAIASYPLMWADRHITDALVVGLGLANPTGARVLPFLALTAANLIGMICLWAACLLALAGERVDHHAVPVVDGLERAIP